MATRRMASRRTFTGTVSQLQRRLRYLEGRPSPSKLGNYSVPRAAIQPKAVSTDQIAAQAVTNDQVAAEAIALANMQANSVGTSQIINGSVTNSELGEDSVTSDKIAADSVGNTEVSSGAIGTAELQNGSVTTDKLASDSVTEDKIAADSVGTSELQNSAVETENIAGSAVTTDKIDSQAVTTEKINSGAVTTDKIDDGAVTDGKIDGMSSSKLIGAVQASQIADLGADKITSGTFNLARIPELPASKTTSGTFDVARIPDLAASKITSGTFAAARIPNLAASKITSGEFDVARIPSLSASKITSGAFPGARIQAGAITGGFDGKIAQVTIQGVNMGDGSVSSRVTTGENFIVSEGLQANGPYLFDGFGRAGPRTFFIGARVGTGSGDLAVGNHTHGGTSSIRYKKDISDYEIADPKKLLNLKLKRFKYKAKNREVQESWNREYLHGYIAEEVQELGIEEILTYNHHGEVESVRYDMLGVLLLELVKEQQSEIESLKEEVKEMRGI